MNRLTDAAWPIDRVAELVEAVARRKGLRSRAAEHLGGGDTDGVSVGDPTAPNGVGASAALPGEGHEVFGRILASCAARAGLETEPVTVAYGDLERFVRRAGPCIVRLPGAPARLLAVLGPGGRKVRVLGPEHRPVLVRSFDVARALGEPLEAPVAADIERCLTDADVTGPRRDRARAALLGELLRARPVGDAWIFRLAAGASLRSKIFEAGLPRLAAGLLGVYLVEYALWMASWVILGESALDGRVDRGWLAAWMLLLVTIVPLHLAGTWLQNRIAIGAGTLFKQRLLHGALKLDPESVRGQGAGQLFGRVVESEALESLLLSGGFFALFAVVEVAVAAVVLGAAPSGAWRAAVLLAWSALAAVLAFRYYLRRRAWTESRLEMTHALLEQMVGHRTRLAQEPIERRHRGEDQVLAAYLEQSRAMDRTAGWLRLIPRGWLALGVALIVSALAYRPIDPVEMAIAIGATLLAYQGLHKLSVALADVAGAAIGWRQMSPLLASAAIAEVHGLPSLVTTSAGARGVPPATIVDATDLMYRYPGRTEPALAGAGLRIRNGDRVLLEGSSGGGKSTLVSLLSGLRRQAAGLLLVGGLDWESLGAEGWRRRVVAAPQFHDNHVLTETLLFNLLMGRRWPPRPSDVAEAEQVCQALGLGPLLERMPAGLMQMVGEGGWQLSHGEKSRVYLARALLQGADLLLLDESFGALDPESLRRCLECVIARAPALLVVAHP